MIHVLTTWMLSQRLGRAERTVSSDESQKVEPSLYSIQIGVTIQWRGGA